MERPRRAILLFLLALLPAAALAQAQEPILVRLNNAVGDTLDLAERDSFHLFPKTAEFRDAVILALPGPEFFAKIRRTGPDSTPSIFLRIMPEDLQRVRFLIDNRESVAARQRSDSAYARGLASFWQTIEEHPLRNMAGEPAVAQKSRAAPTGAMTAGQPQPEPAAGVVRPSDAVGDTIDLTERDSFHLFPNTAGFGHAVILVRPGPEFYAEVTLATADTAKQVFYRIMPGDLQRLRFLVNNREYVAGQQQSDTAASQSLASFWQSIEEHPLRSTNGEPANAQEVPSAPAQAATAGKPQSESVAVTPQPPPATTENRYNYALHGIACGSAAGGCIGSWAGLTYLHSESPECSPAYSVYRVEPCVYWGAAIGATALGTGAGYAMGDNLDRQATSPLPLPKQGSGGSIGCTIGAAVPGVALGTAFFLLAGGFHYGKTGLFDVVENDRSGLTYLPMALTGLCITVEITTIGYRIGRAMDRKKAQEAEAKRRALSRQAPP